MSIVDRNDITHYFDEEVTYRVLPEYKNSYIFYNSDFLMCNYDLEGTEERALLSKLLTMIKESCVLQSDRRILYYK